MTSPLLATLMAAFTQEAAIFLWTIKVRFGRQVQVIQPSSAPVKPLQSQALILTMAGLRTTTGTLDLMTAPNITMRAGDF
jgi:hypothetical protein